MTKLQSKFDSILQQTKSPSQSKWSSLINGIVRPPRSKYRQKQLQLKSFTKDHDLYQRKDIQIKHKDKVIIMTLYLSQKKNNWIVLYLHGNSSSRAQSSTIFKYLPQEYSLASFDFIGCGQNHEDDVISLGVRQSEQVKTVVDYLQERQFKVILWGRSMGAATALKYGKSKVIVADSSFQTFKGLCKQIAKNKSPYYIPNCFISCLFPCIFSKLRNDIIEKGRYDIQQLDICQSVKKIDSQTLIIFMSGDQDQLINKQNSQRLYNIFKGRHKYLQIFKGNHNSKRPEQTLTKVMNYIVKYINSQSTQDRQVGSRTLLDGKFINQ